MWFRKWYYQKSNNKKFGILQWKKMRKIPMIFDHGVSGWQKK